MWHRHGPRAGVAIAALTLLAAAAPAAANEVVLPPSASGLSEPAGLAHTPNGLFVSDAENGICRIDTADPGSPRLVEDTFCRLEHDDGPGEALQLGFDAATNSLYAAEGDRPGAVWRLEVDPVTGSITDGERIWNTPDPDERLTALALSPTGDVDVASDESLLIRRITNPAGCAPSCTAVAVGRAPDEGSSSLAHLGEALYLADESGVFRIATPGPTVPPAQLVPSLARDIPVTALAADEANGRVYAGTTNGTSGSDTVEVLSAATGAAETYATGFGAVGALAVGPGGDLFVADDPAVATGQVDAEGGGRVLRVPFVPLSRPRVLFSSMPPAFGNATSATFEYSSRAGTTFECTLDGAPESCAGTGDGSVSFDSLADGAHTFRIRGMGPDPEDPLATVTGEWAQHVFVVDTVAPLVSIDNLPSDHTVPGGSVAFRFTANELNSRFECSLDGEAFTWCEAPKRYSGLTLGDHTFNVRVTDPAGNPGAEVASWPFTVVPAPPPDAFDVLQAPLPAALSTVAPAIAPRLPAKATRRPVGRAALVAPRRCQNGPFRVRVDGRQIARVIFSVDGKVVKTLRRQSSPGRFSLRINGRKYAPGRHRLTARVVFRAASASRPRTLRSKFARCARHRKGGARRAPSL
jgi:hypothetical protein